MNAPEGKIGLEKRCLYLFDDEQSAKIERLRFAMLADYFGRRHFGTIMGLMMTFSTILGVFGPVFVGWMVDVRGNYREPYLILAVSLLARIPLILSLKSPQLETGVTSTITP